MSFEDLCCDVIRKVMADYKLSSGIQLEVCSTPGKRLLLCSTVGFHSQISSIVNFYI